MGLFSFLFPSLRKPKPFFAPPSKPPLYPEGQRVWVSKAKEWGTVTNVFPHLGEWRYDVDLHTMEWSGICVAESELSLLKIHPYWKP